MITDAQAKPKLTITTNYYTPLIEIKKIDHNNLHFFFAFLIDKHEDNTLKVFLSSHGHLAFAVSTTIMVNI